MKNSDSHILCVMLITLAIDLFKYENIQNYFMSFYFRQIKQQRKYFDHKSGTIVYL